MNDFLSIKDKAISKKIEIAKLMSEVIKHNGNVNSALGEEPAKQTTFDFTKIREMIENEKTEKKSQTIELNKDIKNK